MNDRFKFRAYNKELRKMYEVNSICPYEDNYTKGGEVFLNGIQYVSFYFPEEVEVMQSTGLKDKNGKLIYEGDIVKETLTDFINEEFITMVKWDKLNASYNFENLQSCEREVIGNIYENKELLEDTE